MKGVNPRGDRFIAHEVFYDAAPPLPDHRADMMNTITGKMHYRKKRKQIIFM